MINKMSNKRVYLILFIIMLAGIIWYTYGFFVQKTGTHSDEEWSFGLANSYFEPYIMHSDNSKYEAENVYKKNTGEWISGDVIFEYMTVQEDERFSFDSVYYNQSCDAHPPLYYYILHFLSSFFVDEYVPALAFLINVISYIIMSIFLYKLMLLISKSRFAGVVCVLFNTFTMGTLSMMIYMRMYVMVAMFAVILAYLNAKIYYVDNCRNNLSTYIELIIITLLGALTHHYFLPYAFIVTAIMCICWLVKRARKTLVKYSICMLLGAGLSILLFPATLDHMFGISTITFSEYSGDTLNEALLETVSDDSETVISFDETTDIEHYKWKLFKYIFALCFQMMFCDEIGWSPIIPYSRGLLKYIPIVLIILGTLFIAVNFLFRKEEWFLNFKQKAKNKIRKTPSAVKRFFRHFNWLLFTLCTSIVFILFVTCFVNGKLGLTVTAMGDFTNRYFFIIYPIFSVVFVYFIYLVCKKISFGKLRFYRALTFLILVAFFVLSNCLNGECIYYFKDSDSIEYFEEISEDSDFIIVSSEQWLLTTYTNLIYNSNQFFYVSSTDDIYTFSDNLEDYISSKNLYLVLDTTIDLRSDVDDVAEDLITLTEYIPELLGKDECELVHTTHNYARTIYIYQIQ